jgi:hypothetical protein
MEIIPKDDAMIKGEDLLENNEFMKDLSNIMENNEFNSFFNKYFKTNTDTKVSLIYMKLYNEFKKRGIQGEKLDKRINTFIIWKIMTDRKMRPFVINNIEEGNDIFDEFSKFVNNNELLEDSKN